MELMATSESPLTTSLTEKVEDVLSTVALLASGEPWRYAANAYWFVASLGSHRFLYHHSIPDQVYFEYTSSIPAAESVQLSG